MSMTNIQYRHSASSSAHSGVAGKGSDKRNSATTEDIYSLKPIPLELRKPWTYHAAYWAGVCFVLAAFMGGATPLAFLPFNLAVVAIVIGNIILLTIFILTSYIGAKSGLSTYVLAERAFGSYGARALINLVVSGIPAFAWYGVETWLAAAAIGVLAGWNIGGPGKMMDLPTAIFTLLSGIAMAIPPVLGITSIAIIDFLVIPIMILFILYGVYLAVTAGISGGYLLKYVPPTFTSKTALTNFMLTLNLIVGLIIVGATLAPDSARWIKPNKRQVVLAGLLGFFAVAVFMEIIGAFFGLAAIRAGLNPALAWNIILVLKSLGVASGPLWPLLVLAFLLQFSTNMANAYSGGLALTATFGKPHLRRWFTLGGAIAGSLVAILGIIWYWIPFLNTLANWVGPVAAVLIAEYYLVRKCRVEPEEKPPKVRVEGLIAWFIGGLIAYLISTHAPYFIPTVVGMLTAIAVHLLGYAIRRHIAISR